jgi:hypothetical protein
MKQTACLVILILLFFGLAKSQSENEISDVQKADLINLMKTLPVKGEFFTDKAIDKAQNSLPVLFAFTEQDLEKYDIYPFLDLSRGLADREDQRKYAAEHFSEIRYPLLKLFWGVMLFNENAVSPEIVGFLKDALKSEKQSALLSEITGPNFRDFRQRVENYSLEEKQR